MTRLVVDDVEVRYGDLRAVACAAFTVEAGQMLAVTGPSGAGKTSLLWATAGAVSPSAGQVLVDGETVTDRAGSATQGVAFIAQGNALVSMLSAYENLAVPMLISGVGPAAVRERVVAALAAVGLEEWAGHLIDDLSGGQQQRVAVARALATHPRVLLADEPTSDLDAGNRSRVMALMRQAAREGAAVVFSTHDPAAAVEADGEISLDEGELTWVRPFPGAHWSTRHH